MSQIVIKDIKFVGSFTTVNQCPKRLLPEYAFVGRSNVGKSSLINMLTGRKDIARVSNTPGKTQHINYYLIDDSWYLVDLPGYGYAKISKSKRKEWTKMIDNYFIKRTSLICIFELLDSRRDLQEIDLEFINWLGSIHMPFSIVYTKTDKLKKRELSNNLSKIRKSLMEHWHSLPQEFVTSAKKKQGREDILKYILDLNKKSSILEK